MILAETAPQKTAATYGITADDRRLVKVFPQSSDTHEKNWIDFHGSGLSYSSNRSDTSSATYVLVWSAEPTPIPENIFSTSTSCASDRYFNNYICRNFEDYSHVGLLQSPLVPEIRPVQARLWTDRVIEMLWTSERMFRVSAQVFKDIRPLTDKERLHLRKFYRRAYKAG